MDPKTAQPERRRSWDGCLRREVNVECRVVDEEERSVEVIASSETLDSHGDIIKQHWDLERFNKNAPVLWNHNMFESSPWSFGGAVRPEDLMVIGKATDVRVVDRQLVAKLVLVKGSPEQEPLVDKLWRRIRQGMQRAVSVGFRPGQVTRVLKADGNTDHFELGSAERPNELREISFVPMGSNPDAVAKSIAWEHENLGRMAANETAKAEGNETMAMTPEEVKALEDARVEARTAKERCATLESELKTEKAANAKLETELKAAGERAAKAEGGLIESEVAKMVGTKITPAEKDEHVALAKEIGLARVQKMLAARPDLKLLDPVKVDGKDVATTEQKAPPATDPAGGAGDGSAEIVKAASAKASARPTAA